MSELRLFSAVGVELEYMIVDSKRLNVRPIADRLLVDRDGEPVPDLEFGAIAWSNELINHVVELKTNGPAKDWVGLAGEFHKNILQANKRLVAFGARLMPGGMHPWMHPEKEKQLWFGDAKEIYDALESVFQCSGHGWTNVQSMHINLPFVGDEEFGPLHAAVRLLLPLLPGIAASSPIVDGQRSPYRDARLHYYGHNCDLIPSVTGGVIPEPVFSLQGYREQILEPMYQDIAAYDSEGLLQEDFINARGAIPRFERSSLEIRLLDTQECVTADLAIAALVTEASRLLVTQSYSSTSQQQSLASEPLREIYNATVREGEQAVIENTEYLKHFGVASGRATVADVWCHLANEVKRQSKSVPSELQQGIEQITSQGTLASRILRMCGSDFSPVHLKAVYSKLCDCLAENRFFVP